MLRLLKKLFKKGTDKEDAPPDNRACGNTAELNESLKISFARCAAEVFCPETDTTDCSKEEQNALAAIGWAAYWMACGFHASAEDVTHLKNTLNSSDTEAP